MAITAAQLEVVFSSSGGDAVRAEIEGVGDAVESAGSGFDSFYDQIKSGASGALDAINGIADGIGKIALTGLTAILGKSAKAAWDQVSAVEEATYAMTAYGDSVEDVNAVLQDLTAYAQDASRSGGRFWSQELYSAAQTMITLGAEISNVSEYVQVLSRSVGLNLANWDDLLRIVGRVASSGRITTNELELLRQAGFRLGEEFRNVNITWEELFLALDAGLPAEAITGQATSINTALEFLQAGFVNIGRELLGVGEDLTFIAGGLGDRLTQGIEGSTAALNSFASFAGYVGQAAVVLIDGVSGLADAFQMLPSLLQMLVGGLVAAVAAWGMFRQAIAATRGAMNLLGLSSFTRMLSPMGLAITGVALAAGVLWTKWQEGKQATDNLAESTRNLKEAQQELLLSGLDEAADRMELFYELMADLDRIMAGQWEARVAQEVDLGTPMLEILDLKDAYTRTTQETEAFTAAQNALGAALQDTRVDGAALMAEIESLYNRLLSDPTYNIDQFDDDFIALSERIGEFRAEVEAADSAFDGFLSQLHTLGAADPTDAITNAADAITFLNDAIAEGMIDMEEFTRLRGDLNRAIADGSITEERAAEILIDYANAAMEAAEATARFDAEQERHARITGSLTEALELQAAREERAATIAESWNAHLEARNELIAENIARLHEAAGVDDPLSQWNMGEFATDMSRVADATLDAATGLETVFRVVVGNTDAIANQADSVQSWIDGLMTWSDEQLNIHNLVAEGFVTQQQYNDALEAQGRITAANAHIQRDVLTMQAIQAPLIAEQTEALEAQLHTISSYPAEQQLIALGWMDATTAGRAMEFQMLAIEAASGRLGDSGRETFESMITGAAQADPVLKALLVDMELISVGADGEIRVHLDGAEGAMSEIEALRLTINALIETLGGEIPDLEIDVTGEDDVNALRDAIQDIPDEVVTQLRVEAPADDFLADFVASITGGGDGAGTAITVAIGADVAPAIADIAGLQDQPQIDQPVGADTGPALADLDGLRNVAPIEVPVTLSIGQMAGEAAIGAAGSIFGGSGGLQDVTITIEAVDNATPVLEGVTAAAESIPTSVTIWALAAGTENTIGLLNGVQSAADAIPLSVTTWTLVAGSETAIELLNSVQSAATTIPTSVTTWTLVAGSETAIELLNSVQAAANAIPTSVTTWTLVAGSDNAIELLNSVQTAANAIPTSVTTWTLVAGSENAIEQLNAVAAAANAVPTSVTVSISAVGGYAAGVALGNSVASGARSALGIRSPSRVFEEIGQWSAAGFERGWENSHHDPSIGFSADTNYGAGFGAGNGDGGRTVNIAQGAVNITVNAETDADAEEIAQLAGERTMTALKMLYDEERHSQGVVSA